MAPHARDLALREEEVPATRNIASFERVAPRGDHILATPGCRRCGDLAAQPLLRGLADFEVDRRIERARVQLRRQSLHRFNTRRSIHFGQEADGRLPLSKIRRADSRLHLGHDLFRRKMCRTDASRRHSHRRLRVVAEFRRHLDRSRWIRRQQAAERLRPRGRRACRVVAPVHEHRTGRRDPQFGRRLEHSEPQRLVKPRSKQLRQGGLERRAGHGGITRSRVKLPDAGDAVPLWRF